MTVSNTAFQNSGTGDGVTTALPFTWRISEDSQVAVYIAGVKKTLGVDYTVSTNVLTTGLGGTVTMNVAPGGGVAWLVQREPDQLQSNPFENNEMMPPATVQATVDKLTMLLQDALREFVSTDTTIAAGQSYVFAHSLGKIPRKVNLCLVCQNVDGGYAVGDVIDLNIAVAASGAFCTIIRDMTNITVKTGPAGVSPLAVVNKAGGVAAAITPFTNWKLRVYAS